MESFNIILSHFFIRGKPQTRWRDRKTGRFVKGRMFRYALGVSHIPYGKKYYSFTLIVFSIHDFNIHKLDEMFIEQMEDVLGYDYKDWWFPFKVGYQKISVKPDEALMETWEFYVENMLHKSGGFRLEP